MQRGVREDRVECLRLFGFLRICCLDLGGGSRGAAVDVDGPGLARSRRDVVLGRCWTLRRLRRCRRLRRRPCRGVHVVAAALAVVVGELVEEEGGR